MNYLLFSGSLRKDSLNKKLLSAVKQMLSQNILATNSTKNSSSDSSHEITVADLKELNIPVYDGDLELLGMPDGVQKLGDMIKSADAIIISSPEYNGSIAGSLKNCIDWVSRLRPIPLDAKPVLLMGASPGAFGAIRSLSATRTPLENLNCYVYPQSFALPKANEAFDANNKLVDEAIEKRLSGTLMKFSEFAKKFKNNQEADYKQK